MLWLYVQMALNIYCLCLIMATICVICHWLWCAAKHGVQVLTITKVSLRVTILIVSAVTWSGMSVNDSIVFIMMCTPSFSLSLFILWLCLDS